MGFFFKKANKTNRCLLCGSEVAAGKCTACGREAKPLMPLSALNWQKVPLSAGEALGEQKKKLPPVPLPKRKNKKTHRIHNGPTLCRSVLFVSLLIPG